ncbi:HNH endonuclease [uncultured Lamprocystis sp.]|jgi:hypothetical protein|uniref:HNH endonuclease n=1 Tax=uncultured Lamprocystis sp. TaxID=543132 RepID=UPI0025E4596F|nr:HNH endonuclease [uncultured Lamprocystis sp.]
MADALPKALRERISVAAGHRCGYCQTDQRVSGAQMHVEHIVPRALGGSSQESNLWLSCAWCNSYKGIQVEAPDPNTGQKAPLFNPRGQRWAEHFAWDPAATHILGLTPTGRATVAALNLNNPYIVPARRLWVLAGWHPPNPRD